MQIVVNAAPFPDGPGNGAEVVVRQHDAGRFLGGFGAFLPHSQPDVGALQGGGVVDAVAGHGGDFAVGLQGFDKTQLVFRTRAGEHVHFFHGAPQGFVVHFLEFGAGNSRFAHPDIQAFPDDAGGFDMVARDHFDDDSGMVALVDRQKRFFTRGVDDAEHAEHDEVVFDVGKTDFRRIGRDFSGGDSQCPLAV